MITHINEFVSVDLLSNHNTGKIIPWAVVWREKKYRMKTIGLHYMIREGRTLFHIFSVTDGTIYMKLSFNTESLRWKLLETDG